MFHNIAPKRSETLGKCTAVASTALFDRPPLLGMDVNFKHFLLIKAKEGNVLDTLKSRTVSSSDQAKLFRQHVSRDGLGIHNMVDNKGRRGGLCTGHKRVLHAAV